MPSHDRMMKRQQALADFGEFTLRNENLDEVLTEACRLVSEALGTGRAKVLEIQVREQSLLVRAGVGWDPGIVGQLRLPMSERSSETFAISESKPVITQDLSKEERFVFPEFMKAAGVVALANVPIRLPGGKAYGLLQVDATEPRDFSDEDTGFLRTYATILGPVIDRLQKQGVLRVTEERFRLVVENARDYAIFTSDPEDRITDWYPGAEAVYGWSAAEAVGQPAAIIFTQEDREAGQDALETEMAAREGSAPNVRWHLRKDGSRVFIEGMTTSLRAADGSLRGFLKIGQDVTERRQADEALRQRKAQLAAAFESVPVGIAVIDTDGKATIANAEYRRFLPTGVIPSRDPERCARWRAWDEEGKILDPQNYPGARAMRGESVIPGQDMLYTDDDGREIWTNVATVPTFGNAGHVTGAVSVISDIDERQRSAEALRQSEERLRQFGEASSDVLWIRDAESLQWIYVTPAFEAIYGLDRETALHDDNMNGWLDLIVPEDRQAVLSSIESVCAGERVSFEYRIRRPLDGEVRWLRDTDFPMRDPAGKVCWLGGVGRDITEEKAAAKRQEVLINELQHRSRNLLGVVTAVASRTVKQGGPVEAFEERLQALGRVQALLSKGGSDTVEVGALVRAELAAHADGTRDRATALGPTVLLTARHVQNFALAVHELTTNAVKYGALKAETGRLDVTRDVALDQRGRRRLALSWIDSGVAIDPEKVTRRGYGTELIQEAMAYALEAKVDYALCEDGVRCRIEMPVS
ncbi:PAS domain S-box protein [Methylobacterium sp. P31]